jgi:hypothetical protein
MMISLIFETAVKQMVFSTWKPKYTEVMPTENSTAAVQTLRF